MESVQRKRAVGFRSRPTRYADLCRLEWPDDPPPTPEELASLRDAQRELWAKIPPPIYDTRVIHYPEPKLDWD